MTISTIQIVNLATVISVLIAMPVLAEPNERHKKQHNKKHWKQVQHKEYKHQHHKKANKHQHRQHQYKASGDRRHTIKRVNRHTVIRHSTKHYEHSYAYATVIHSKPVYKQKNYPQKNCWQEHVSVPSRDHSLSSTIAGGLIGGVVGHQFGGGHGKDALTIAGAAIGASIGHDADKRRQHSSSMVHTTEYCERQNKVITELTGYKVKYRYDGEIYHTFLSYKPGSHLKIESDVETSWNHHY